MQGDGKCISQEGLIAEATASKQMHRNREFSVETELQLGRSLKR